MVYFSYNNSTQHHMFNLNLVHISEFIFVFNKVGLICCILNIWLHYVFKRNCLWKSSRIESWDRRRSLLALHFFPSLKQWIEASLDPIWIKFSTQDSKKLMISCFDNCNHAYRVYSTIIFCVGGFVFLASVKW